MGDVMLSIGEIAHATGVSRRMLRHWETAGLIAPAEVDDVTGYRRYARSQVGKVRAIASLRTVGFGLETIGDLLSETLSEHRLVDLLRAREGELMAQIEEANESLGEVRTRLTALQGGREAMQNIELGELPAVRLAALQTTVGDESEIPAAVADLLPRLRERLSNAGIPDADVVLTYDGTSEDAICVTVGTPAEALPGLGVVELAQADRGVTARLHTQPVATGDAWLTLDAHIGRYGLETTNVYRQTLESGGGVMLQAPVRDVPTRPSIVDALR